MHLAATPKSDSSTTWTGSEVSSRHDFVESTWPQSVRLASTITRLKAKKQSHSDRLREVLSEWQFSGEVSSAAVALAAVYLDVINADGADLPTSVSPSPDSGVIFTWNDGQWVRSIEFLDGIKAEYVEFFGPSLVESLELKWLPDAQVFAATAWLD